MNRRWAVRTCVAGLLVIGAGVLTSVFWPGEAEGSTRLTMLLSGGMGGLAVTCLAVLRVGFLDRRSAREREERERRQQEMRLLER